MTLVNSTTHLTEITGLGANTQYSKAKKTQDIKEDALLFAQDSIKEYEGATYLIVNYQYISANGNVINHGCESYVLMDEYALGNVQEQSIEEIYIKNKSKKLVLK